MQKRNEVAPTFPHTTGFQLPTAMLWSHPIAYRVMPTWPISPSNSAQMYARTTFGSVVVLSMNTPRNPRRRYALPNCHANNCDVRSGDPLYGWGSCEEIKYVVSSTGTRKPASLTNFCQLVVNLKYSVAVKCSQ